MLQESLITGNDVRRAARRGDWTGPTPGLAPGYAQANLVIVPESFAEDFQSFCEKNPKPCPLLEVTATGDPHLSKLAEHADLRTDLPRYRIWNDGEVVGEPTDNRDLWRADAVAFLIGCSFTFDDALQQAGLPVRHIEEACNVPMYRTTISCEAAGPFRGPLVVSMRPMSPKDAVRAAEVTARFPHFHGTPVHVGDPPAIGIKDLGRPDYGDAVSVREKEVPVFWACGVTPQAALIEAKLPWAITHAPGHMFVTDRTNAEVLEPRWEEE